jgi:hypothetical protein
MNKYIIWEIGDTLMICARLNDGQLPSVMSEDKDGQWIHCRHASLLEVRSLAFDVNALVIGLSEMPSVSQARLLHRKYCRGSLGLQG